MSDPIITRHGVNRRAFLAATVPAIAATSLPAAQSETGARTTPLTTECPGAQYYDEKERVELNEAYDTHTLFRYYGLQPPVKVAKFEQEFGAFMGAKYVLAVTSGTAALHIALTALGVGPGDEVILPAWTWHSCYTTILMTGALPVFAEVDESFTLDPADVEAKITPQTKVIMAVHLFGGPVDMDRIMAVGRKHGVKVLEDAAQSVGAQYKGKRVGTIGDAGIYSFQIHKMITAGEGGAIVTADPMVLERAARFHDLGLLRPTQQDVLGKAAMPYFVGVNYRMNEMTGAVMRAQLRKLDMIVGQHRQRARYVRERIQKLPGIKLRRSNDQEGELGWTVDVLLADMETRDRFVAAMEKEKVPMSSPSGAMPLPNFPYIARKAAPHPAWPTFNSPRGKAIVYGPTCCQRTTEIYIRAATLTIGPKYTNRDLDDAVAAITKVHRAISA